MRALFVGTCAKEPDRPETNEDAYAFSVDRQRLALSDGASESYDSRLWARLLAGKFADDPRFDQEWIESAVAAYQAEHDFAAMTWSQQLAFERGCFATLLGVEHDAVNHRLSLFGVGDSVAVLLVGVEVVRAWPLDHPDRFKERPTLLSTLRAHNEFTQAPDFGSLARIELDLAPFPEPKLLCMTDALGEWTLRMASDDPGRLADLLAIRSSEQLTSLVVAERDAKRMRVDDSTLAILKFGAGEDAVGLPLP
ncbi:hypothetical protein MBSD_n2175 [Mizugakiibacter sediminis]|uniref:Serine/threonine protein phosphatase n=1 Tax=Mizugakiibacter sediminis TaxID=1475481 RepID=A0A0K8QPN3_9GAMM|nr:hypothetical protein [Mizugakiibacter sediminis]GAP66860.1 hypothetical protein MBSD_n2175 [Mizugakiibacter sediminis]